MLVVPTLPDTHLDDLQDVFSVLLHQAWEGVAAALELVAVGRALPRHPDHDVRGHDVAVGLVLSAGNHVPGNILLRQTGKRQICGKRIKRQDDICGSRRKCQERKNIYSYSKDLPPVPQARPGVHEYERTSRTC